MIKIAISNTFTEKKEWILLNKDNSTTRFIINQGKKYNGIRITK